MSKAEQMDRLIERLSAHVAVGILTRKEAETILQEFGRKIGYY